MSEHPDGKPIVNDFCITISTINGSGSATANNTLLRALFKMGIPVSGKNIFPSNIQGLPTWYTIRVSKDGYLGRVEKDDVVIAMNPATIAHELESLVPGGILLFPDDVTISQAREDVILYPMPVKKLIRESETPPMLRDYIANMVYVGVLAFLLGIDLKAIREALSSHFKGKEKAIASNFTVVQAAADWAAQNITKTDRYSVQPMDKTKGYVMSDGNTAAAIGALYGGLQFSAWYPITPATSLAESLNEWVPQLRKDAKTGKISCAVVQSEDELAAIGMTIGAGWAGLRAMTSTSGPGLSLMTEYLGTAYYAEVPVVVWDVQRVGPSTGLPTRTGQGDITMVNFLSHGDTQYIQLFPASVNECFEFGWKALDIAERLQTPVIVMSDLDLGMNQWMTPKFEFPDKPMDRGKILWEEDLQKFLDAHNGEFGRYVDYDGDGIPYRTLMGNRHPQSSYFTRGTGHDEYARYTEDPETWERGMKRLTKKFETAKKFMPNPEILTTPGAKFGILSIGSCDPAVREARDLLLDMDQPSDYLRLRALPITDEVKDFIAKYDRVYVVEMNRDGQLCQLLSLEVPTCVSSLRKVAHLDGLPLSARWIKDAILSQEKEN
ncbi:MAG TPA: 2-oxoacid:acceptor oxidoreductase subunit alpha [Longilinea sp.]|nr:2-oxoacid:acceptor oxidoreductase subunit alpha [Longilinea sp.]